VPSAPDQDGARPTGSSGNDLVVVGRIGKAHGLRGDVGVEPWTDDPELRFAPASELATASGSLTVAAARVQSGRWVVRFEGIEDRTAAEALRGTQLLMPASARPPLTDPDDFYDSDLIGLAARRPDGEPIGPVTDVVHGPAGDFLVVVVDDRDRLVPFVAAIVPTVDVAGGFLVVDAPDGLFDL
jgi:16S rRNA processing protein RimM